MTTKIVPSISDEQLAELERAADITACVAEPWILKDLCSGYTIRALIARLRAAEKDAARYRWLRASDWYVGPDTVEPDEGGCRLLGYANENSAAEDLDKAIDTAMEQQP